MLGKTEGKRRRGRQRMRWLDINSVSGSMDVSLSKLWETAQGKGAWCAAGHGLQRVGHDLQREHQLENLRSHTWLIFILYRTGN